MRAGTPQEERFFDAGVLIGALLSQDLRHAEALPLVEAARRGDWAACTSTGILAEVYVHLTNERASPPHTPAEAQAASLRLIEPPSALRIVAENGFETALHMLSLAEANGLRSKNVPDARHAASALGGGATTVFTYDPEDWKQFEKAGLRIGGPASTLRRLGR
jgi:predicted nucleic acid-binding protein